VARSNRICAPHEFTFLCKQVMKAARRDEAMLPAGTRVTFQRLAPWDDTSLGCCDQKTEMAYVVDIVNNLAYDHTALMIVHEVAHAIHWCAGNHGRDHGPAYWKWHGQLYCRYLETT
jgi:hypothetical protein